ncbi:hypothetical protein M011DRAFT_486864 [Sporormia fimetaria CBS 119925]|uniref:Uncharacterized protein n=1 Tax=Sporormia fimetaria CBS 119925 TaxID=1340428 RepID=A0A6A6V891_9PLEO|nr:hypothetical protein M011DRAFT_486864 [Sporormia fimetaria CBS 119925]
MSSQDSIFDSLDLDMGGPQEQMQTLGSPRADVVNGQETTEVHEDAAISDLRTEDETPAIGSARQAVPHSVEHVAVAHAAFLHLQESIPFLQSSTCEDYESNLPDEYWTSENPIEFINNLGATDHLTAAVGPLPTPTLPDFLAYLEQYLRKDEYVWKLHGITRSPELPTTEHFVAVKEQLLSQNTPAYRKTAAWQTLELIVKELLRSARQHIIHLDLIRHMSRHEIHSEFTAPEKGAVEVAVHHEIYLRSALELVARRSG